MRWSVVFLVMLAILGNTIPQRQGSDTQFVTAATEISLTIDFGNGTIWNFEGLEGATVLDVTEAAVEVEIEWYGDLVFVTGIAGVKNDPERNLWWQYWVNGELGPVAANKYNLADGDHVEWRMPTHDLNTTTTTTLPIQEDPSLLVGVGFVSILGAAYLILLYIRRR